LFGTKFVFTITARYIVHMLNYGPILLPLISYTNEKCGIVTALLYLKVTLTFAMQLVHLYGEKFVFSLTAQ